MSSVSPITCHVLDSSLGKPGAGVTVVLKKFESEFVDLASGVTNSDGRCTNLLNPASFTLSSGIYKLVFNTGAYFEAQGKQTFYPVVEVTFEIKATNEHYHVPLLLNPYSYTTYRGS